MGKATGKLRGFGFVQFDNTESVELIMLDHESHQILGQWVDVKKSDGMKGKGKGATAPAFGVAYAAPTFQSCGKGYGGGVVARSYAANFVPQPASAKGCFGGHGAAPPVAKGYGKSFSGGVGPQPFAGKGSFGCKGAARANPYLM